MKKKRYFIDSSTWTKVHLVDVKGEYGYITTEGYVISYTDKEYLILYDNIGDPPYLLQVLDIGIINTIRTVKGLR